MLTSSVFVFAVPNCPNVTVTAGTYFTWDSSRKWISGNALNPGVPIIVGVTSLNNPNPVQYVVGVTSGNYTQQLLNGVPAYGSVFTGHYKYYALTLWQPGYDVSISVDLSYGLVNLYLSMTQGNTAPTVSAYDFASDSSFLSTNVMVVKYSNFPVACRQQLLNGTVGCVCFAAFVWPLIVLLLNALLLNVLLLNALLLNVCCSMFCCALFIADFAVTSAGVHDVHRCARLEYAQCFVCDRSQLAGATQSIHPTAPRPHVFRLCQPVQVRGSPYLELYRFLSISC
jgi:hypothetical protein